MNKNELVFLKLGGSLITDKNVPFTAKYDTINNISQEIAKVREQKPEMRLVIGHGSGSFGHVSAEQHQTHSGGKGQTYWDGFAQVWKAARALNQIIVEGLSAAGLPVMAFPPSASVTADEQTILNWDIEPLRTALSHGLIPLIQGDVIFDAALGGTILSTEQLFIYLAQKLNPCRILLAGLEEGVYLDPQQPNKIVRKITPATINQVLPALTNAKTADVTGGMLSKVQLMLSLIEILPDLEIQIFSGIYPGNIEKALMGEVLGTVICADPPSNT
jgi:isopentenyl phosphate kinase